MFSWLRRRVTAAILGGVQDAVEAIEAGEVELPKLSLPDALVKRLESLPVENGHGEEPARKRK